MKVLAILLLMVFMVPYIEGNNEADEVGSSTSTTTESSQTTKKAPKRQSKVVTHHKERKTLTVRNKHKKKENRVYDPDAPSDHDPVNLQGTCTEKYRREKTLHTMCVGPSSIKPTDEGISPAEKKLIVTLHNNYRANTAKYTGLPAKNMLKMYWDDEIATVAQKWASNCAFHHDENRSIPGRLPSVGQNIGIGYPSWQSVVDGWHAEVKEFKYGDGPENTRNFMSVGHYTQVVSEQTNLIGCGFARCNSRPFLVCNYGPSGNTNLAKPYESGRRASGCRRHASNGLCDCGTKVCLGNGKLNLGTCKCDCPNHPWFDQVCNVNCSKAKDPWVCPHYGVAQCSYSVLDQCPIMCGIC